ncbi:hypothetical protein EX895_002620 [Sporisorium graminicola]|uniref:Heme haloperoxidase family profile domain-containing protein n=1 Tax=Sporisorium graminicola TaxID=280036 RepID=A0A4U7KVH6_9BASI|nr:hypothetical protein EX895_002620 [Sporisorium graminicola]TKY88631.1 hypothetical protein EX895_002620 [Sporisorium graminicola]
MKITFSLPLLAMTAFMAAPSFALPNIGAMLAPGPKGEPSIFEKRLALADPLALNTMFNDLKSKAAELNKKANFPDASKLSGTKIADLTPDKIYSAFGLRRDGGLLPPGEDAAHPWKAPRKTDKRGPCPGLNTIANHGYLPRNGIVSPVELLVGTFEGLNLGPDLAAIAGAISFVGMGDLTTMTLSIGDRHGLGDGLNHHGILEGDGSVTRLDHYFGNSWDANPKLVQQFINETNTYGRGNVDVWSLANSRYRAWDYGRKNNPIFDFNPWRMLVAYTESGFTHEVLRGSFANFDESMIKSWFVEQRFPKGWSKRLITMTTPELLAWAGIINLAKPTVPGWNLGTRGAFLPAPTASGVGRLLNALINPKTSGATVADFLCNARNAALSNVPTQLVNLVGGAGATGC